MGSISAQMVKLLEFEMCRLGGLCLSLTTPSFRCCCGHCFYTSNLGMRPVGAVGEEGPVRARVEGQPVARPPGGGPQRSHRLFSRQGTHTTTCTAQMLFYYLKPFFLVLKKINRKRKTPHPPTPREAGSVFLTIIEFSPLHACMAL